jgi:DNA-binding NtrC family response regulator
MSLRRSRRILLVEADDALALVITRLLDRHHTVVPVTSVAAALRLLEGPRRYDVVLSARRIGAETAGQLFDVVRRRWPDMRRIVYAEGARVIGRGKRLADNIVDASASFADLIAAIDGHAGGHAGGRSEGK